MGEEEDLDAVVVVIKVSDLMVHSRKLLEHPAS